MRCAIVTCRDFADQPPTDDLLLEAALTERGALVDIVAWESPYDWSAVDLAVVRSAWNSHLRYADYLAWTESTARRTRLVNPPAAIAWNMNKARYFRDLGPLRVTVPTAVIARDRALPLTDLPAVHQWRDVVIKPAVGANSHGALRIDLTQPGSLRRAQHHIDRLLCDRDVLIQPYLPDVAAGGEHSHVFLGGLWSHAFAKLPFAPRTPGGALPERRIDPDPDEVMLAIRILDFVEQLLGGPHLPYARVDLVRDRHDRLALMEIELNDPCLRLDMNHAAHRFCDVLMTSHQAFPALD
jgi:hypothetical protein